MPTGTNRRDLFWRPATCRFPTRTFQLWIIPKQGQPISAGVFSPGEDGRALHITSPQVAIADAAALAITDEPAGGQPQPTSTPIWVGPLG